MSEFRDETIARRKLSRSLSDCAGDASGRLGFEPLPPSKFRIGITGSPGAGKSSLIGVLAAHRASEAGSVAVLAIDPTSPLSRGSVLGDRIRMDQAAGNRDIFIRSLPSRSAADGLCDNIEALLRILERSSFGEIALETVGAGQVQHTVRTVTDTTVMVLSPHAGDSIQAMKAGLMEMADIYVVNKSDLPDARRAAADIRSTVARERLDGGWLPPVVLTSTQTGAGILELSQAIDRHRDEIVAARDAAETGRARLRYHVNELLQRRLAEAVVSSPASLDDFDGTVAGAIARFSGGSLGKGFDPLTTSLRSAPLPLKRGKEPQS